MSRRTANIAGFRQARKNGTKISQIESMASLRKVQPTERALAALL